VEFYIYRKRIIEKLENIHLSFILPGKVTGKAASIQLYPTLYSSQPYILLHLHLTHISNFIISRLRHVDPLAFLQKFSNINKIYKKGDRSLPSNCRPISLTFTSCKLMEATKKINLFLIYFLKALSVDSSMLSLKNIQL